MKFFNILLALSIYGVSITQTQAQNLLWIPNDRLREGDVRLDDIPNVIKSLIDFAMGIAGTIAIIFIIIWAYRILFGSLEQDKTKGRETITVAIVWFILASLAWVIVKAILSNFGG